MKEDVFCENLPLPREHRITYFCLQAGPISSCELAPSMHNSAEPERARYAYFSTYSPFISHSHIVSCGQIPGPSETVPFKSVNTVLPWHLASETARHANEYKTKPNHLYEAAILSQPMVLQSNHQISPKVQKDATQSSIENYYFSNDGFLQRPQQHKQSAKYN